jgi:hypothetical protein
MSSDTDAKVPCPFCLKELNLQSLFTHIPNRHSVEFNEGNIKLKKFLHDNGRHACFVHQTIRAKQCGECKHTANRSMESASGAAVEVLNDEAEVNRLQKKRLISGKLAT